LVVWDRATSKHVQWKLEDEVGPATTIVSVTFGGGSLTVNLLETTDGYFRWEFWKVESEQEVRLG
jgi:hypothetical protein